MRIIPRTPEELWKESGLSREEWNTRLAKEIEKLKKEGREEEGLVYALMMIGKDGKSLMTKIRELGELEALRSIAEKKKQEKPLSLLPFCVTKIFTIYPGLYTEKCL